MSLSPSLRRYTLTGTLLILTMLSRSGWSENDTNCLLIPDTACFTTGDTAIVTIGKNVTAIGGTFRFSVEDDAVYSGIASVRVILVIDRSYSMCGNPRDSINGCCTEGDGTGNCMMNDPADMRIAAAHRFVDSLAKRDPVSEVGVIAFDTRSTINNALPLNSESNIASIHHFIDEASCAASTQPLGKPLQSSPILGKIAAVKATYIGLALEAGLRTVDNNFSSMPPSMSRHIIQLTDGAWDDTDPSLVTPDTIINRYKAQYPDRSIPIIHGIFLRNKELHTAHSYPEEGCSSMDPIVPGKLEHVTVLTGGLYFPGSTPSTIVDNFMSLSTLMYLPVSLHTYSLSLTNGADNQVLIPGLIRKIGNATVLEASPQNLPIETGANIIKLKRIVTNTDRTDSLITVILTIIRDTQNLTAPVSGRFTVRCNGEQSGIGRSAYRNPSTINRPEPSNAAFNLLGKKVGRPNSYTNRTPTGMYLRKSQINSGGKSKVMVK